MNIFTVLNQGRGRINEENMSAMLAFLLSPDQTHSLQKVFLKEFLNLLLKNNTQSKTFLGKIISKIENYDIEVILESPYEHKGKKRYVDIEIQIFDELFVPEIGSYEKKEILRIVIENKIKHSSASENQFKEEVQAAIADIKENESNDTKLIAVFLTPSTTNDSLKMEYEKLNLKKYNNYSKCWVNWTRKENKQSITGLLSNLLKKESNSEINPISDYLKYTLKAFIRHIVDTNYRYLHPEKITNELGDIKEKIIVNLSSGKYRIEQYESTSIKIYNIDSQEYEVAKPILRQIKIGRAHV